MRIVTGTIIDEITDQLTKAREENKEIRRIELAEREWRDFWREVGYLYSRSTYGRVTLSNPPRLNQGGSDVLFDGVPIVVV